ncbi:MAG: Fic family protein, partial [Candidatus Cloacimonetes bacterium]|nr:Fic family protein [Candidatus Cloacimonadota bacterium]
AGTVLKNELTGETVYTPPQDKDTILELMSNLEEYMNVSNNLDPLIKMGAIHYQFESIHPFYDGNGRTGRILNVLFLVLKGLLDIPILYLSKYIIRNKAEYYRLIQHVHVNQEWEEWILFILEAIEKTSLDTIVLIKEISRIMDETKSLMKSQLPKIYSKELLESLFMHPYTKTEYIIERLNVHRDTASTYLKKLTNLDILECTKLGRQNYYINKKLYKLLAGQ